MKKRTLLSLLLLPALLAGCAPSAAWRPSEGVTALTTAEEFPGDRADFQPQPEADAAIGTLGAELLRAVRTPGENTLLSPLSITLALSMTANGAAGDTLAELEALLGAEVDALNENAGSLLADYLALAGSTESAIANSLWMDDSLAAGEVFLDRCTAFYRAEVYQADLPTEETRDAVNDWIGQVTRGMIPRMLQDPPREDAALLLVNALYMKNTWEEEFDANDTHPRTFTAADGTETELDFLHNGVRRERYFAAEDAAGVVLPYDDGRLGFLAVLPDGELDPWLEGLDGETFSQLLAAAEETEVALRLPKFEAEWGGSLTDALRALGRDTAFDPAKADFSPMGTSDGMPLFLASVDHRAKIEVTEEGTEAAAATVVIMAEESAPMESPAELTFDRPFCYAIVDLERGVPLFLGTFERP